MENKAVCPGSFDPITNGHVDIVRRGLAIFDAIVIAVLENPKKDPLFTTKERVAMIRETFAGEPRVEVRSFQGLLVEFARASGTNVIIRGLRAVTDFEYEFQMALMNRNLAPEIETFYMMPSLQFSFLSSNLVREISLLGGGVGDLVPPFVERRLRAKMRARRRKQL